MANPAAILILYSIALSALLSPSTTAGATTVSAMTDKLDAYFTKLTQQKPTTLTKLKIYIHADFASTENQTVFNVAAAEITPHSPSNFGQVIVLDNPLTTGLDPDSQPLGQYQGMNTYADSRVPAPCMFMTMIFYGGDHDSSTLTIMGRQPTDEKVRLMSVVGGTRSFRFAKGIVLASTYSLDTVTKIGTYIYEMYVVTPAAARPVQAA